MLHAEKGKACVQHLKLGDLEWPGHEATRGCKGGVCHFCTPFSPNSLVTVDRIHRVDLCRVLLTVIAALKVILSL